MDSKRLEQLIEKYWSCETTLEEEQELKAYFGQGEIPEQFQDSGLLFQYLSQEKKKSVGSRLTDESILEKLTADETSAAAPQPTKTEHYIPWFGTLSKIAAVLVVALGIVFYINREQVKEDTISLLETDTYEDTQKAYEETVKALNLLSKHLNKGKEQTMKLAKFNEAEEVVQESIVN